MSFLEIFHVIFFILFGIISIYDAKSQKKKASRYRAIIIGILALGIAAYDILTCGFDLTFF